MSNFRDFLKEQLQDPEIKKEYEALAAAYAIKQAMIDSQKMSQEELSQRTSIAQSDGVAAFGGIAPTYQISLLDKPTIVWDFHSLLIGLQMMFSFMLAEDKTPLRMCDHCDTIFIAKRKNQYFCSDKCRRKGE